MPKHKKIGIILDDDFALRNMPPYPRPTFLSYETPLRIKSVFKYFESVKLYENEKIFKLEPKVIDDSIIALAHTKYHIDLIKNLSDLGNGLLSDEVFITNDTFMLAKKAIGGSIQSIESVLNQEVNQSFALVRPPGHHALREKASGFCIFNNIANSVIYLRERLNYKKRIAIIDIDNHFGDGLVQYFYDDPSVLYFSIHEFDFVEGDMGFINELGEGDGLGKSINFPIPMNCTDDVFLEFMDILEPILNEFAPDLIIVAAGFDMHFSDPIGNNNLTSISYYTFCKRILDIADKICNGKLVFVLEGGYSLIALPYCIHAVISALLDIEYKRPFFENIDFLEKSRREEILKIKNSLKKLLSKYWTSIS
ncbi:MAG: histone deacetylase [Promethearchaeota archaeon]